MTTEITQVESNDNIDQADAAASASINLADLQNVVRVIDHACEQGAFKGWAVINQVFTLRSKIDTFVTASLPPEPEPKARAKPAAKTTAKATKPASKAASKPVEAAKKTPAKKVPAKRAP